MLLQSQILPRSGGTGAVIQTIVDSLGGGNVVRTLVAVALLISLLLLLGFWKPSLNVRPITIAIGLTGGAVAIQQLLTAAAGGVAVLTLVVVGLAFGFNLIQAELAFWLEHGSMEPQDSVERAALGRKTLGLFLASLVGMVVVALSQGVLPTLLSRAGYRDSVNGPAAVVYLNTANVAGGATVGLAVTMILALGGLLGGRAKLKQRSPSRNRIWRRAVQGCLTSCLLVILLSLTSSWVYRNGAAPGFLPWLATAAPAATNALVGGIVSGHLNWMVRVGRKPQTVDELGGYYSGLVISSLLAALSAAIGFGVGQISDALFKGHQAITLLVLRTGIQSLGSNTVDTIRYSLYTLLSQGDMDVARALEGMFTKPGEFIQHLQKNRSALSRAIGRLNARQIRFLIWNLASVPDGTEAERRIKLALVEEIIKVLKVDRAVQAKVVRALGSSDLVDLFVVPITNRLCIQGLELLTPELFEEILKKGRLGRERLDRLFAGLSPSETVSMIDFLWRSGGLREDYVKEVVARYLSPDVCEKLYTSGAYMYLVGRLMQNFAATVRDAGQAIEEMLPIRPRLRRRGASPTQPPQPPAGAPQSPLAQPSTGQPPASQPQRATQQKAGRSESQPLAGYPPIPKPQTPTPIGSGPSSARPTPAATPQPSGKSPEQGRPAIPNELRRSQASTGSAPQSSAPQSPAPGVPGTGAPKAGGPGEKKRRRSRQRRSGNK